MALCVFKRGRPVGLDLTTKRVDDDSRKPEMKKPTLLHGLEWRVIKLIKPIVCQQIHHCFFN
jgi:hypothetical protein